MKTIVKLVGVGATVTAFTLQAAPPVSAIPGVPFTNAQVDRIQGGGSDTTFGLMNDLASAYGESDGCLLEPVVIPLVPASGTQNTCQTFPNDPALPGDNIYENYDHDVVVNFFPQGSGAGRLQLCNQKTSLDPPGGPDRDPRVPYVDFARSSSAPSASCNAAAGGEDTISLDFVAFARDAISFTRWNTATGGGGAVSNLTVAQLRGIFITCAFTDWGQVGGVAGRPINVFTAIPLSGTRVTWEAFLGGGSSDTCITDPLLKDGNFSNGERVLREHQMQPIEVAFNDPGAADEGNSISYMSVGLWNSNPGLKANSLIGNVNGIAPTETTIVNGSFPFSRNMYNVYRSTETTTPPIPPALRQAPFASSAVRRFMGMVTVVTPNNIQSVGWICKGDSWHSEQIGNPSPEGIETATATQDWADIKRQAFEANGFFQLAPQGTIVDPADGLTKPGHRCLTPVSQPVVP